ncbi:ATP-binding protein [Actinomycetospora chiangmaiensis]|uniref:ATP-binding protein n=1 Tax=Actinomycetospora chiangmaiensis TaxID=402650 RepID=UPI000526D7FD|nr:helicase HerA-like domain-containing protein [Actinomycetospora chiangmaiensis]
MSTRLGSGLADHIKRMSGSSRFILIEGVSTDLAEGMANDWDSGLPPLAIVSDAPERFGQYALVGASGTELRNRRGRNGEFGVVLVLCEGQQVPDRQSLTLFESISPSVLLESAEGLAVLAKQKPPVALDGPVRAVRDALLNLGSARRPGAASVASYFDRVAAGTDPLKALTFLGAYADHSTGERVDSDRIIDNLNLARQRTSEDVLRPVAYAELRRRTERVLARRPALRQGDAATVEANRVMALLQAGDDRLLETLQFDEAREIFEQRNLKLPAAVATEVADYRNRLSSASQAAALPWDSYVAQTEDLRRGPRQREAAQSFCDLDDGQEQKLFSKKTRGALERLLRDKSVDGSRPSCPEAALARAAQQLGGTFIQRVQVLSPTLSSPPARPTRSSAGQQVTLACARLRLGALLRKWNQTGGEIDGLLLQPADTNIDQDAFVNADLSRSDLPPLQLRVYGEGDGNTVQVDWRPDLDDVATLRAAMLFAESPTLTLAMRSEPSLATFCTGSDADAPTGIVPPTELLPVAQQLNALARNLLEHGLDSARLQSWCAVWEEACNDREKARRDDDSEQLTLAGAVVGPMPDQGVALTPLAPLKAEWLGQYHDALRRMLVDAEEPESEVLRPVVATVGGIARTTAAHYPPFLRLRTRDRALLPSNEGRVWSLYGGSSPSDDGGHAGSALEGVLGRLLALQPEAAGHLKCLTWGPGAADLLVHRTVQMLGRKVGRAVLGKVEIFCIGSSHDDRPRWETLHWADDELRGRRHTLELRYVDSLDEAAQLIRPQGSEAPAAHLALVTGLTEGGNRLQVESPEVDPPSDDDEVLFAPRTWQRARQERRTLLMPPGATGRAQTWLKLQNAVDEGWPEPGDRIRVPEVRTGTLDIREQLQQLHDLALWIATLDRYATRDSLEQALGDEIAILHQEKRLGGDSPLSLVLSQKSGGPADRAIGRSLRTAGIVADPAIALNVGTDIRKVASQGYGILALQAATTGAGINELVGHVVAFSLLATTATPWPLPPGCRVLLVGLDEYRHWFPGKRGDLLALALDSEECGVHVAVIEVKARRSDETDAGSGALDQLQQTLAATRWAAYPEAGSVYSRLWLNRITEAAYAVARESRFRLDKREIAALEAFRRGNGTLEWAGIGLVFGPHLEPSSRHYPQQVAGDIVPVVLQNVQLTQSLLEQATHANLTTLRTVEATSAPLQGGRTKRRPEARKQPEAAAVDPAETNGRETESRIFDGGSSSAPEIDRPEETVHAGNAVIEVVAQADAEPVPDDPSTNAADLGSPRPEDGQVGSDRTIDVAGFAAPVLGWDATTGEEIRWHPAGPGQDVLQNGHAEIWGSSGMGKTQFVMSLLGQLSHLSGSKFGIADFKNDYSDDAGFPSFAEAEFLDLWNTGAPYNPLALESDSDRAVETAIIALRDTVDEATRSFTRMGVRQRQKLVSALRSAYQTARTEDRWPTLLTLDDRLDDDLAGVLGDLTHYELFRAGPPLGDVIDRNVVFGLSHIPGNGQTTILAAGFILSALLLKVQDLPPVPNTVRYVAVVDEAHRVKDFRALQTMIREGRSKGLAVVLATQQPLDLPEVVAANAQTKICFGLPDATVATMAARKLEPDNPRLTDQIRSLGVGEAYVSLRGSRPRLVRMAQAHRDAHQLGLPRLTPTTRH